MRQWNNKGLTLVELILTMAISAIVIGAIITFMSAGVRSYHSEEVNISLQTEAQTVMNQISSLVMEGNNVYYDAAARLLTIYHFPSDKKEIIYFDNTDHNLYLYYINATDLTSGTSATLDEGAMNNEINTHSGLEDNLMGEYISNLEIKTPTPYVYDRTGQAGATLGVKIDFQLNGRIYTLEEDIKLRNRVVNKTP